MRTTLTVSELTNFYDDELIADIDRTFDEIARSVEPTPEDEPFELLLVVDELVEEMISWSEEPKRETLEVEVEVEVAGDSPSQAGEDESKVSEVA